MAHILRDVSIIRPFLTVLLKNDLPEGALPAKSQRIRVAHAFTYRSIPIRAKKRIPRWTYMFLTIFTF